MSNEQQPMGKNHFMCVHEDKVPQQWTRGSADKDLAIIAQKGRSCSPIRSGLALANKPNCPSEASHVMKTSFEMNYMSVNPLINIMDLSFFASSP